MFAHALPNIDLTAVESSTSTILREGVDRIRRIVIAIRSRKDTYEQMKSL